jgi:hemolysin activation/secretion protein
MTDKNAFKFFKNRTAMTTPTHGLEVSSPSMSTYLSAAERRSHNTGANLNMFKTYAVTAFALVISAFVFNANAAVNTASTAGSVLREAQPSDGFAPLTSESELSVESQDNVGSAQSAPFLVKVIEITGNTLFSNDTLTALVADAQGQSLTLAELSAAVARITDYYRSQGYPLARAIIPAQEIADGVVRINVLEARFGTITLTNTSLVDTPLLEATIASLLSGQVIGQAALDEALLQLSDIPGIVSAMTLKPGQLAGTSDLLVTTAPGPAVSGNIAVDNNGNAYTGRARVGAALNVINPFNSGGVLSINALTAGSGMDYGRISYEALVSGRGTRLGGAYSALNYKLGPPLASLSANGSAQVQSLWVRHPLLRSRPVQVYAQVQYDHLQLRDRVDVSATRTDRQLDNLSITVSGQSRNTLSRNSVSAFSVGLTAGQVGFDNAAALASDAANAKTQGRFSKLRLKLTHLQTLTARNGLYLSVDGQWASTNLDASQKMGTGGPHTVRGYDTGTLSGDEGTVVTAEWRYQLGNAMGGQWQGVVFADSARVTVNKNTLNSGATNTATLSGAGIGLKWVGNNNWSASAHIAQPIGSKPELVTSRDATRAWVELKRGF